MTSFLSFTSVNHPIHKKSSMIDILIQDQKTVQCLSCLIEIVESPNVTKVHRHLILSLLHSAFNDDNTLQLIESQRSDIHQLICIVLELCTDDLIRPTAASFCASLIHKLQDEKLYQVFMEKFQANVLSTLSRETLHLHFMILSQLTNISVMYSEMVILSNAHSIISLLDMHQLMDEATLNMFIFILTNLIQATHSFSLTQIQGVEQFVWKVLEVFIKWINTLQNYSSMVRCLGFFKECLKSEKLATGLLLAGHDQHVLFGLKRILATKDTILIINGTQCLSLLLSKLQDPEQIQSVFDTDIAEFIFEFLHSTHSIQLDSTLQCLFIMTRFSQFYERCHAVYGLESVLKATTEALFMKKFGIVDKCLTLLTCFLERQPDTIPLFVNQSWNICSQLLLDCLQKDKKEITLLALQTTIAFLKPQYWQTPINIGCLSSLLTSIQKILEHLSLDNCTKSDAFNMLTNIGECIASVGRIIHSSTIFLGNEADNILQIKTVVKYLSENWILLVITVFKDFVKDNCKLQSFLTCLDLLLSLAADETDVIVRIFSSGLPFHMIYVTSQLQLTDDSQKLMCQSLTKLCVRLLGRIKPSVQINPATLFSGFTLLKSQEGYAVLQSLSQLRYHEEIVAFFTMIYLSYYFQYYVHRYWKEYQLQYFLSFLEDQHPELLERDQIITKAYVFLDNAVLPQLEKNPIESWFTFDVRVFLWSLATENRTKILGSKLVEYWTLNLNLSTTLSQTIIERLVDSDKIILSALRCNQHFLYCVINLLDVDSLTTTASDVLLHCVTHPTLSSKSNMSEIMDSLLHQMLLKFNSLLIESLSLKEMTLKNYLRAICAMISSPLCSALDKTCCLKPICHVVKFLSREIDDLVVCCVQFISLVVFDLSSDDSRTIIPLMFKSENFVSSLEYYIAEKQTAVFQHAIIIVGWLSVTGKNYQTCHPIIIPTHHLMTYLASNQLASLPMLQLIHAALSSMFEGNTSNGAVRFVKQQSNFMQPTCFSFQELQQVYIYLQQIITVQKNSKLKFEAISCLKILLSLGEDISEYVFQQSWNPLMLETILSTPESGLTESEIEMCYLLSAKGLNMWTSTIADGFLLALLNSDLADNLLHKATYVFQQIKLSNLAVDTELMSTADECFANM